MWRAPSARSEAQFEPERPTGPGSDTQDSELERVSSNGAPSDQSGSTVDSRAMRTQSLASSPALSHIESAANSATTTTSARQANRFHPYHAELACNRVRMMQPRASPLYHHGSFSSSPQMPSNAGVRAPNRHLRLPTGYFCAQPMAGHYPLADSCQHLNLAHRSQCFCMFMPLIGHEPLMSPASNASQPGPTPFTTIQLPINKSRPTVRSCSPHRPSKKK